ncbi:MAG: tetratricopeptide repeat protein [Chloroflexi bacterium]|nr:tetratricopeptide repeat protein [Chloroflexota bacterium]
MHAARLNLPDRHFHTLYNLAYIEIELGEHHHAEASLNDAYSIALEQQNELWKAMCYSSLGRCVYARGDRLETLRLMTEALEVYERAGNKAASEWVRSFLRTEGFVSD